MIYIFEKGQYPSEAVVDERDFQTTNAAVAHAKSISADYVWNCPDDQNPSSVYRKCKTCDGTGEVHSHNPSCWDCRGTGNAFNR